MNLEPFTIALTDPLGTATGPIEERSGFLIRAEHRGDDGVGEATPLPGWTESTGDCERALETATEAAARDGLSAARRTLPADAPAARHGVSTALLDADACAEGVPLYAWFDGDRTVETVPVNATVGDGGAETTADAVERAVDAGFEVCKIKVGARSIEDDLERLRAVRDAVGDCPGLRVDANGAWSLEEAVDAFEELATLGVSLVEQPLDAGDLDGHAELRGGPVAVALDESLVERGVAAVLDADAADALVLKPMVLGGPGEAYAIATRCRTAGVEPIVSSTVDAVVARTAAVHVAAAIPDVAACGLATADRLATDLGPDPAPVREGTMLVPQEPGLGIDGVAVDD